MITKSIFKSSLFIAVVIQLLFTSYIFVVTYLINDEGRVYKFGYFTYVSFLALQFFPFCFIIVLVIKILIAYFKKK